MIKFYIVRSINTTLILILFLASALSCSSDRDLIFLLEAEEAEVPEVAEEVTGNTESPEEVTDEPCTFLLDNLEPNAEVAIDCVMDLGGKDIILPSGATITYDGGRLINGSLNFSQGKIDGRLLNKDLTLAGDVRLIDPNFGFVPENWSIKQGTIDGATAFENRLELERLMNWVKEIGATTFTMAAFDAYFEVVTVTHPSNPNFYATIEAINVPSDFNLVMGDDTHLRVYPNSSQKYSLLALREVKNTTVSGGHLHGDRDEHDYSAGGSHEWGHLLDIHAAKNVTVSGVTMKNGSGDGMDIHSLRFTFQDNYIPSENIRVTDCVFDSNRRNNLSITDGKDIIIENSTFLRAGVDTDKSKGTNPRFAIDVEAYRSRVDGEIVFYEKVDGVIIRNNIEKEGSRGGFLVAIGDNVTIEENTLENGITYKHATGTIIRNNVLEPKVPGTGLGINAGQQDSETSSNNQVYGNTITNYGTGMHVYGKDNKVHDNIIKNCETGIMGKNIKNTEIYENSITSENADSRGLFFHVTDLEDVSITNNTIDTPNNPFTFTLVNVNDGQEAYTVDIAENKIRSAKVILLNKARGIHFRDNEIDTGIEVFDSTDLIFDGNKILAGIFLRNENHNLQLNQNEFQADTAGECIKIQESTLQSEVLRTDNTCNGV